MSKLMRVRATSIGYANGEIRQAGDVFTMPAGSTASWFKPADTAAATAIPDGKANGSKRKKPEAAPTGTTEAAGAEDDGDDENDPDAVDLV